MPSGVPLEFRSTGSLSGFWQVYLGASELQGNARRSAAFSTPRSAESLRMVDLPSIL